MLNIPNALGNEFEWRIFVMQKLLITGHIILSKENPLMYFQT